MKTFDRLKFGAQFVAAYEKACAVGHTDKSAPDYRAKSDAFFDSYYDLAVAGGFDRKPWFIDAEMELHFKSLSPERQAQARRAVIAAVAAARKRAARR